MGEVHILRGNRDVHSMWVREHHRHRVWIKIIDKRHPKLTRWIAQFAIQRAASFRALDGFTDAAVRAGKWHGFYVSHRLLARFAARDLAPLVSEGLVRVEIDGEEMEARAA